MSVVCVPTLRCICLPPCLPGLILSCLFCPQKGCGVSIVFVPLEVIKRAMISSDLKIMGQGWGWPGGWMARWGVRYFVSDVYAGILSRKRERTSPPAPLTCSCVCVHVCLSFLRPEEVNIAFVVARRTGVSWVFMWKGPERGRKLVGGHLV